MTAVHFGDDAIIRTDEPTTLRCGGLDVPPEATLGTRCRAGCRTQDHASWGDCLRAAQVRTYHVAVSNGYDATAQKKWDRELDAYKAARDEGIQPDGTTRKKIDEARRLSDQAGAAYGRDFSKAAPMEN